MVISLIGKMLAGKLFAKIAKTVFIRYLELKAEQSENTVDDELVAALKAAL